jgi:hypothetical protein
MSLSRRKLLIASAASIATWSIAKGQFVGGAGVGHEGDINPTGVTFNPTSLFVSNTGGWWDPSDHATTFQDTAGTTPANADGQTVQRINDKSGNGNNLIQAAGSTLNTAGGLWWLTFNGSSNWLTAAFTHIQPATRIMAHRIVSYVDNTFMYDGFGAAGRCMMRMAAPSPGVIIYSGGVISDPTNFTVGTNHVSTAVFNTATSSLQVDNIAATTGDCGATTPDGFTVGAQSGGAAFGSTRWYGGLTIGRLLTAPETANSKTFFGAKAGLSL